MARARATPANATEPPVAREIGMMRLMARLTLKAHEHAARLACAVAALWIALAPAPAAHAQARPQPPIEDGSLLVANAELQDAAFSETVVLVLRHDDVGTVGLIVNRPTSLATGTVFPELAEALTSYKGRLYRGGPAQPLRPLALVQGLAAVVVQGPEIVDKIFLSVDPAELGNIVRVAKDETSLRIFAGHVEWAPGQIETEVAQGIWRVVRGSSSLVFSPDPRSVWREATALATGSVVAGNQPSAIPNGGSFVRSALR
jgi:putative transcriptional regulator